MVAEDKLSMITTVHFEGACVTWKDQARFMRFVDPPNASDIKNSEIGVLL